ncbi:MAG TPA: ABC transporter ATP-binding protein, partial [Verrucomicrobiae bacterium]|nr:ABC transporter ATP-binding protein [Verrucomicrobiae bacterium]
MSDIAIHAEGISKRYPIGVQKARYKSLRDSIMHLAAAPLRSLRRTDRETDGSHIWALKDVSFEVARGEVLGIIGHNGSGKSTLLKILSRITRPTEGNAVLRGRVGCLLEVGTGFHQELTGRENIYLNGAMLGMKRREIQRKFDEIVNFSEVEQFIDTPVKFYSTGMYLRLAFAVAAHLETEILLVDEVLAVGDIAFQKKCLGKMSEVADAGRTIIFISHNMAAVTQLCSRIIWLDHGTIRASGQPDQLTAEYSRRAVEEAQPVNLADAPRSGSGKARFTAIRAVNDRSEDCRVFGMGESLNLELEIHSPAITR